MEKNKTEFLGVIPVIPSADIERDVKWYEEKAGFKTSFVQIGYAEIYRENIIIHLQWHRGTADDPIFGSVIKIFVENIDPLFKEFVERGTVLEDTFREKTAWKTKEFGFYDLNKNAIFIVENLS